MKIFFLVFSLLCYVVTVYSQAPKGPGGSALYKKGDCERSGVDLNICTYCEDKELTKNCKEYWCTDNGTCTEAPLKKPNNQLVRTNVEGAKYRALGKNDTTSKLPKGTKFVNGKVTIQSGYKAVQSSDKKMVIILADNGLGARGSFRCDCDGRGTGACNTSIIDDRIICGGDDCCELVVTINDELAGLTMEAIERAPEKLKWKKLLFPIKSKQGKVENDKEGTVKLPKGSVDITELISTKKVTNGTVVIYQTEDKYKIYATYKNGKLIEWYAMGGDGKKIKSSPVGITPTICEDCMITPGGVTVCKKCTVTPGVALPAKKAD